VLSCGLFGYLEMKGFFIKTTILLFACCFQGNLLDPFLECPAKEERQTFSEVGMSHDGDCGYGNFRQAWMVVAEKA
jgi:hypothetical protein